jgi:cytoskeletal protein CcmA (bactofilin family)
MALFDRNSQKTSDVLRHSPTPVTSAATVTPAVTASPIGSTTDTRRPVAKPAETEPSEAQGSRLIVGPNIKLKGAGITDCDTLIVEGHVEATMESRMIQIAEHGTFSGTAAIQLAEIHGGFSGELTVSKCLTIYATGRVTGKVRYGKLVIEEGGELAGDIKKLGEDEKGARLQNVSLVGTTGAIHGGE